MKQRDKGPGLFDGADAEAERDLLRAAGWVCCPLPGGEYWKDPVTGAALVRAEAVKTQQSRKGQP